LFRDEFCVGGGRSAEITQLLKGRRKLECVKGNYEGRAGTRLLGGSPKII